MQSVMGVVLKFAVLLNYVLAFELMMYFHIMKMSSEWDPVLIPKMQYLW